MTSLYLFDENQELLKIIPRKSIVSAVQKLELQQDSSDLPIDRFTAVFNLTAYKELDRIQYYAVKDLNESNTFHMYYVQQTLINDHTVTLEGVQLGYRELKYFVNEDLRPVNRNALYMLQQVTQNTGWRVGYVAETSLSSLNFYYLPVLESLKTISNHFGIELVFKVQITGQKITDKWIEAYDRLGAKTKKRFTHGTNALEVKGTIERSGIYTALIGRGKGEETDTGGFGRRISFEDVEWKIENGDPVNKPLAQNYVEIPEATNEHGVVMPNGIKVPAMGIVEFEDIEEAEELLRSTYDELVNRIRPLVQYQTTVADIGNSEIGETVTIHRYDLNIHYMTRIFKLERDYLFPERTPIELGDVVIESRRKKENRTNRTIENISREQTLIRQEVSYVVQTADGMNTITYSNIEPERKRVGDSWIREHPVHEGFTQWLVWDGTAWEITSDSYETEANRIAITEQQAALEEVKTTADYSYDQLQQTIANSGFTDLDTAFASVQTLSEQAESNAQAALSSASNAVGLAEDASSLAATLSGQVSDFELTVNGFNQTLNNYTDQVAQFTSNVNGLNSTVASYETQVDEFGNTVSTYATQVSQFENTVDGLNNTVSNYQSDVDSYQSQVATLTNTVDGFNATVESVQADYSGLSGTVQSLGASIGVVEGQITNRVWQTDIQGAIDGIEIGGRNLLLNSEDITQYNIGYSPVREIAIEDMTDEWGFSNAYRMKLSGADTPYSAVWTSTGLVSETLKFEQLYTHSLYIKNIGDNAFKVYSNGLLGAQTVDIPVGFSGRISFTGVRRDSYDWYQIHLRTINTGEEIELIVGRQQLEKGNVATDWTRAPEDNIELINSIQTKWTQTFENFETSVTGSNGRLTLAEQFLDGFRNTAFDPSTGQLSLTEQTINGLQDIVSDPVNGLETKYTQLSGLIDLRVTSAQAEQIALAEIKADKTIKDTRNDNQLPSWYFTNFPRQTVKEFKSDTAIGLSAVGIYGVLITEVPWANSSGGRVKQIFYGDTETFQRYGNSDATAWGEWDKMAGHTFVTSQFSILDDKILAKVSEGEVYSQLLIDSRNILFDANDRFMISANKVVIDASEGAFITSAIIESLSADKITAGTIDASQINVINLDADEISAGTIHGALSDWNLNTGIWTSYQELGEPGDTAYTPGSIYVRIGNGTLDSISEDTYESFSLRAGVLVGTNEFPGYARRTVSFSGQGIVGTSTGNQYSYIRSLDFTDEGMEIKSISGTGTQANTSLRLTSIVNAAENYIQFADPQYNHRIRQVSSNFYIEHDNSGELRITNRSRDTDSGVVFAFVYATRNSSGDTIQMIEDRIQTPRNGIRDLFLSPNGTGKVRVANKDRDYYPIRASDFENASSRNLKTNINPLKVKALDVINDLTTVSYNLKSDLKNGVDELKIGLIAEDSLTVASADGESINTYTWITYITKAVQELSTVDENVVNLASKAYLKAESNEERIKKLEAELKQLKGA